MEQDFDAELEDMDVDRQKDEQGSDQSEGEEGDEDRIDQQVCMCVFMYVHVFGCVHVFVP